MEESETSKTKASDSAYSNSSTSQYQRSDGSSKSRHSNSSGSSGYCGQPSVLSSGNDDGFSQPQSCTKRKEKKRKQHKQESSSPFWEAGGGGEPAAGDGGGDAASAGLPETEAASSAAAPGPQEGGGGPEGPGAEGDSSEALQMAALTQTLHCIKRMKEKEATLKCLQGENGVAINVSGGKLDSRVKEHLDSCFTRETSSPQDEGEGFVVVVSMADGTVVHTTSSLTASLGFPSDMWQGRDFIDFVHPKDRMSFASHITSGVARGEDSSLKGLPTKTSFYCSLRKYRGLHSVGYGVTKRRVPYLPFRLTFTFREMNVPLEVESPIPPSQEPSMVPNTVVAPPASPLSALMQNQEKLMGDAVVREVEELNRSVFIVITATRIYSAYKVPNEEIMPLPLSLRKSPPPQSLAVSQSQLQCPHMGVPMGKFVTRHLSSCHLSHVDPLALSYLGYLPQDMEGRSVMDFYHPEDMPILKEAYQNVMNQPSSPFKGKPYRFRAQNGCYILIETEWSSFVNPWSRKLEFVIGQHHVLKGPSNPQVFAEPNKDDCHQFPDMVLKESETIHKDILFMLDQVCSGNKKVTRVSESARQQVSKRCRDLASFMETLMDEMAKPADPLRVELPAQDEHCFSERDSVMLGEISPHHDYYDGKSSTETPPSYNQLNYNENLQRFFESKPKTTLSDESADMKMEGSMGNNQSPLSTDEEGKSFPNAMDSSSASGGERKYSSQANESESGGSGSRPRWGGAGGVGGRSGGKEVPDVTVGSYQREDASDLPPTGGKAPKAAINSTKFKGSRGSLVEGEVVGNKGRLALVGSQEKGRRPSSGQQSPNPDGTYRGPHLTEALLSRHNEDMEKRMVQKHREQRSLDREGKLKDGRKSNHEKPQEPISAMHGVKRSGSHSCEGDHQRVKHQHIELPPQHHGNGIVGSHKWAEHQLPMVTTPPPPPAAGSTNTLAPVLPPTASAAAAGCMASPSMPQSAKGSLRVSLMDHHPLSPPMGAWPPISMTLAPMNGAKQQQQPPHLTYSYPGILMPPEQQTIPNLVSSAPPAIVPHAPTAALDLPTQPHHHHQQPTLVPVPHRSLPSGQQQQQPPANGTSTQPCYPGLVSLQPFPLHHVVTAPHQHQGGVLYYMPAGSSGMVSAQESTGATQSPQQVVGYPHQQLPLPPPVPGYPYFMPVHQSQITDLPPMAGAAYHPNHPQYANAVPQVLYQTVGPAQVNGSAGTQQLFMQSLNATAYVPPSYRAAAPPSAPPHIPLHHHHHRTTPPHPPNAHFLQRARRSTMRSSSHHGDIQHSGQRAQAVVLGGGAKGPPRQGRGRDGLGVLLMGEREGAQLACDDVANGNNGGSPLLFFSSSKGQKPSPQATSVKAEPGSAVGSIASASRMRDLLEVSKKCKSIGSPSKLSKGNGNREEGEEEDDDDDYYHFGGDRKMSAPGKPGNNRKNGDLTHSFNLLQDPETICDDSSYSSLYSFLRTEKSDESMRSFAWDNRGSNMGCSDAKANKKSWGSEARMKGAVGEKNGPKPMRKDPAWLEEVDVTPDLILRYKMDDQILCDVLEADLKTLKTISQSSTVNEQLSQLYMDMELEGTSTKLSLEDSTGFTSSSGTDEASMPLNSINVSPSPSRISHKSKKKRRAIDYGKLVMIFEENAPFPPSTFSP